MENQINSTNVGMSFVNPSMMKENSFSLMVNGTIQSFSNTYFLAASEQSNSLCNRLKGYKVINSAIVPSLSITFLFLVNTQNGKSEIGFIKDQYNQDKQNRTTNCENCNTPVIPDKPLEQIDQLESCQYFTFVNANCLNFNIDFPITSWIKVDDCSVRIYFTDDKNPPRYIDYDKKKLQNVNYLNCPFLPSDQLDCDKIKIFPTTCYPILNVVDVVSGGQNQAGTYQFVIAYSDIRGNKITDYFKVTNPIPLFTEKITVATDYPVAKSIKLEIANLNTDFRYINLAVIKNVNNQSSAYLVDILEVNSNSFSYLYTGVDRNILRDLSIDEIQQRKPIYSRAKSLTESNGYLLLNSVSEPRILNLQKEMIDLPLYCQTVVLEEGDYKDPLIASEFVGYLGDETYPFGISLIRNDGSETAIFHIAGRNHVQSDFDNMSCIDGEGNPIPCDSVTNKDILIDDTCTTGIPAFRYQVYNTAQYLGTSTEFVEDPVERIDIKTCNSQQIQIKTVGGVQQYSLNGVTFVSDISLLDLCSTCKDSIIAQYQGIEGITYNSISYNTPNLDLNDANSSLVVITNSGITQVPVYLEDQTLPTVPNYPYADCPCPPSVCGSLVSFLDSKQNSTCNFAIQAFISSTAQCTQDGGQFAPQYGSFLPNPSGLNTACNVAFNDKNQSWYSFTPTSSTPLAISIFTENAPVFELFDSCPATTPITNATFNPSGLLSGNVFQFSGVTPTQCAINRKYTLLHNLVVGRTYFLKIYSETGDTTPPNINKHCYFRLCITTPQVNSYVTQDLNTVATLTCSFSVNYTSTISPINKCSVQNYKKYLMSYSESTELYPCNEELYGSYAGKSIQHHRFPDETISPFFSFGGTTSILYNSKCKIYPKGISISVKDIKERLENAFFNGTITNEELNAICGYRIWRGDRRGNESIIGKGILRDVWKYKDNVFNSGNDVLFSNFPYNDNRPNEYIQDRKIHTSNDVNTNFLIKHPYYNQDFKNKMYVLDAPNLQFNNPGLGTELKIESELSGYSQGTYQDIKNNATYQYLGGGVISAAIGFASVEAAFEALSVMATATLTISITVLGSGTDLPLGLILAIIGENIVAPFRVMNYYGDWYDIISKFAPFRNYATYYSSIGYYSVNTSTPNAGDKRRTIAGAEYLKPGILNVLTSAGNVKFNNYNRESTVFVETSDFLPKTTNPDNSRFVPKSNQEWENPSNISQVAGYYASMKNNIPNQYGTLDSIQYIDTGFNGIIDWSNPSQTSSQLTIFGGDTYINRIGYKTKIPFFLDDRVPTNTDNLVNSENLDILLSEIPNVAYPVYFMDYPVGLDYSGGSLQIFGDVAVFNTTKADFHFVNYSSDGSSWADYGLAAAIVGGFAGVAFGVISLPIFIGIAISSVKRDLGNDVFLKGKYFHSCYGIPYFLCESNYNLDYRYGENNLEKDFYPHVADTITWTQQTFVPIYNDNKFQYNNVYSKPNRENQGYILNQDFKQTIEDCKVLHPNRIIYSQQDLDQNDRFDGNLIFLANNYHDFPKSGGKITIVKGIENSKVLVIQEDQASVFNSYISSNNIQIDQTSLQGDNKIFNAQIPSQYIKTDLGYGGSQTSAFIATEFGHFWVDNKRGSVFQMQDSIKDVVKPEDSWWFKEHLPFQILRDFPDTDINNNYKYFGMAITYDAKYKRVLFTKRDAILLTQYKNKITLEGNDFVLKISDSESQIVLPTDSQYFCNKSFTISYSVLEQAFTSFHSYTPNYYIPNQQYFQSGINYSTTQDEAELGLWSHNILEKSFTCFYGKKYPFIIEYVTKSNLKNNVLNSVQYKAESRVYNNGNGDYFVDLTKTYSNALVYTPYQSTGNLGLIVRKKNSLFQASQYANGKITPNGKEILIENVEQNFRFNNLIDLSLKNGQSMMKEICHLPFTQLNSEAISYKSKYMPELMRNDYFITRLSEETSTEFQIVHKFSITQQTPSEI